MSTTADKIEQLVSSEKIFKPAVTEGSTDRKRQRLVGLLRGYFATPVIAALGETGMAERMSAGSFSVSDWEPDLDLRIVAALFGYLHSIGLLEKAEGNRYELTPEGRTALLRNGAFSLLMSYADYLHTLPDLLTGGKYKPSVNRLRNVRGSGQLHSKKFFPIAFEFLSDDPPHSLIDVGCGDGCFLECARDKWPSLRVFGVDLSEEAVERTKIRLGTPNTGDPIAFAADAHDIAEWSAAVPNTLRESPRVVISMWFVAHEFSQGSSQRLKTFFKTLKETFPLASVVLGEITAISSDVLASNYELSIMPEFLLFHALSGQGVLPWHTWKSVLEEIPYSLTAEQRLDVVHSSEGEAIPASFIWLLSPQ